MLKLLYKYLILNKKATVPGIGIFYIKRIPAKLDFANKVFASPALQINFKAQTSVADNSMYTFISREKKIDELEAINQYNHFANKLKENLKEYRSAELPGFGVLSQNEEGELFFKETLQLNNYFPPAGAERVLRENVKHDVLVEGVNRTNTQMREMPADKPEVFSQPKDHWWIFAIALGVIGIGAIVYYYLHNGSLR